MSFVEEWNKEIKPKLYQFIDWWADKVNSWIKATVYVFLSIGVLFCIGWLMWNYTSLIPYLLGIFFLFCVIALVKAGIDGEL